MGATPPHPPQSTWATFPTITESTASGGTLPASSAAADATLQISVAVIPLSFPPKVPNGVLLAATIKTPRDAAILMQKLRFHPLYIPYTFLTFVDLWQA